MPGRSPFAGCSDLVALGLALRTLREQRGVQQKAVGFDAGVADKYVGHVENGNHNPSFLTLLRVVRTLDASMSDLVGRYERVLAGIDPHAGNDVAICPSPEALRHLRRISYQASAEYEARKARRARSRMRSWT